MQEDFDKIRLDHVLIIDALVKEYKAKTGKYPFEGKYEQLPVAVVIESEAQKESHKGNVPLFIDLSTRAVDGDIPPQPKRIETITIQELNEELSSGLQKDVTLPVDPQKVPVNKPSVYVYTFYLGVYDITAFLHNEFAFARPLNEFNNKITVGNRSHPESGIWTAEDLIALEEFRTFFQAPFNKPGYVIKTAIE